MKRVWSSTVDELFLIFVKFPKGNDLTEVTNGYKRFGFPNCGGKIDGRHILNIALPEQHVDYMNRKGWYSVIMQGEPFHRCMCRERSGSVVECLTRDREAAGSSLTGVTASCH